MRELIERLLARSAPGLTASGDLGRAFDRGGRHDRDRADSRLAVEGSQRGGERSHSGSQGPTKDQLYEEAKKKNIEGRSSMNKQQLRQALGR
jgi:hypothetical protein